MCVNVGLRLDVCECKTLPECICKTLSGSVCVCLCTILSEHVCQCLCRTKVPALLDRLRLGYEDVRVEATPRRVAVMISRLAKQQRGAEDKLRGPPAKVLPAL